MFIHNAFPYRKWQRLEEICIFALNGTDIIKYKFKIKT